ncbi:MAG TPA: isoprenylcysteine carboxylmethyltransferase family protein [bacterium]
MKTLFNASNRRAIGYWLHRHRKWGLVPLLGIGLFMPIHEWPVRSGNFMMIAGAMGILFGTLLRIVCYRFTGSHNPLDVYDPSAMKTEGPYAVTRNPVYLAEGAIALGIAMMSRMPWFVLVTLVCGGIVTALVIEWEELALHERYGEAYADYCRTVPRWFSFGRMVQPDSFTKTRGRVRLLAAIRAESAMLLIGLLAILAFLAKANFEIFHSGY